MTNTLNFSSHTVARFTRPMAMVRIRFAGETFVFPQRELDIARFSSDEQIRRAVATALFVPVDRLDDHTIDRHADGSLTIRPMHLFV